MRFEDCVGTFLEWSGTSRYCAYCLIRIFQAFTFLSEDSAMQWGLTRKLMHSADFTDMRSTPEKWFLSEAESGIVPLQHQHGFRSTL